MKLPVQRWLSPSGPYDDVSCVLLLQGVDLPHLEELDTYLYLDLKQSQDTVLKELDTHLKLDLKQSQGTVLTEVDTHLNLDLHTPAPQSETVTKYSADRVRHTRGP